MTYLLILKKKTVWPIEVGIMFAEGTHYTVLFTAISKSNLMAVLMGIYCVFGEGVQ